uniref:Type II secretion system protein J n=1 Tax=Hyaloperonospora arabidopsidis (strain Emoy2) TaxID=559515 RepID=M4C657_HYAAE
MGGAQPAHRVRARSGLAFGRQDRRQGQDGRHRMEVAGHGDADAGRQAAAHRCRRDRARRSQGQCGTGLADEFRHPMKPSMRRARSRGFTLIEVILVVLIFGIMAAMAYGGLNSVLKTRVSIEASMKRTGRSAKAYMRMRSDFQNYVPRPIRDNFGDVQPSIRGAREQVVELTRGGWRNPLFLSAAA